MARQFSLMIVGLTVLAFGVAHLAEGQDTQQSASTQSASTSATQPATAASATEAKVEDQAAKAENDAKDADESKASTPRSRARAAQNDVDRANAVELFGGVNDGKIEMKFIAKSDREARVILTNKTDKPMTIRLPEAFAGVPVLNQRPGGGGGGNFGGGGGGNFGGGGGGNQGIGGGFGGGGLGGGGLGGGGGGGFFSIPPEQTARLDVAVVCLDHGLRDPSSSKPYQMVPIEQYVNRPAVIELVKAFGRGELQHGAAQAAAWHLNNDLSWAELAAKQQGSERNLYRPPYFSRYEVQAGMAYATEAARRGQLAQMQRPLEGGSSSLAASSEAISATSDASPESANPTELEENSEKARTQARRAATRRDAEKSNAPLEPSKQP